MKFYEEITLVLEKISYPISKVNLVTEIDEYLTRVCNARELSLFEKKADMLDVMLLPKEVYNNKDEVKADIKLIVSATPSEPSEEEKVEAVIEDKPKIKKSRKKAKK